MVSSDNTLSLLWYDGISAPSWAVGAGGGDPAAFVLHGKIGEKERPGSSKNPPSCPKKRHTACPPEGGCTLLGFVPFEDQHEAIPCHHIPLNEKGETIESCTGWAENANKVEPVLRSWLVKMIQRFEGPASGGPLVRAK